MRRLIAIAGKAWALIARAALALRYMRKLNYSAHLAWIKAAR